MTNLLTTAEAATLLGVHRTTTHRWAQEAHGTDPAVTTQPTGGGSIQTTYAAPEAWWRQQAERHRPRGTPRGGTNVTISNKTHGFRVIEQLGENVGPRLMEVYPRESDEGEPPVKRFYIVSVDANQGQVYSYLAQDHPQKGTGSQWVARYSASGIDYVGNPMTERTARRHWQAIVSEWSAAQT